MGNFGIFDPDRRNFYDICTIEVRAKILASPQIPLTDWLHPGKKIILIPVSMSISDPENKTPTKKWPIYGGVLGGVRF